MNQILETKLKKRLDISKKNVIIKFQFYFSLIFICLIIYYVGYSRFDLYSREKSSDMVLNNYNITKLYTNNLETEVTKTYENSFIIGIIEIEKLDIYYPIFSSYNDDLLKISPCRFYGTLPGKIGNLCIAGHNYDNDKFFSKINNLNINDEIILYNNSDKKFSYFVFDKYEVKSTDLSPIYSYNSNSSQLTLITCNNLNNNRIVIKALYNP